MKTYDIEVTQHVQVTLDERKFTPEFFEDFNNTITDFGSGDDALREHAKHLAWVHATGLESLDYVTPKAAAFVEGYGPVAEMGIKACVTGAWVWSLTEDRE